MLLDERCDEGCYYELIEGVRPEFRCHGKCALLEQQEGGEDCHHCGDGPCDGMCSQGFAIGVGPRGVVE